MTDYNAYELARMAGCASPDSPESAGAVFLLDVQFAVNEYSEIDEDTAAQVADEAPDVYTHQMWAEFVDLAAYNEDPTELAGELADMGQSARICLYMIAERLAAALIDERETVTS